MGWANAPHRVLRNSTVAAWEEAGSPAADRPGEGEAVARLADGTEAVLYSDYEPAAGTEGDVEALAHYAGQSAGLVSAHLGLRTPVFIGALLVIAVWLRTFFGRKRIVAALETPQPEPVA